MTTLRFIRPTVTLEASHATFLDEFLVAGETVHPWVVAEPYDDFSDYVAMLEAASKGLGLPRDFVAHSTFWLVDAADEIVAVSNLRHELTKFLLDYGGHIGYGVRPSKRRLGYAGEILGRTLEAAKRSGIDRVRITCARDNVASARTILRNGGVLDDEAFVAERNEVISRYWIDL